MTSIRSSCEPKRSSMRLIPAARSPPVDTAHVLAPEVVAHQSPRLVEHLPPLHRRVDLDPQLVEVDALHDSRRRPPWRAALPAGTTLKRSLSTTSSRLPSPVISTPVGRFDHGGQRRRAQVEVLHLAPARAPRRPLPGCPRARRAAVHATRPVRAWQPQGRSSARPPRARPRCGAPDPRRRRRSSVERVVHEPASDSGASPSPASAGTLRRPLPGPACSGSGGSSDRPPTIGSNGEGVSAVRATRCGRQPAGKDKSKENVS